MLLRKPVCFGNRRYMRDDFEVNKKINVFCYQHSTQLSVDNKVTQLLQTHPELSD